MFAARYGLRSRKAAHPNGVLVAAHVGYDGVNR